MNIKWVEIAKKEIGVARYKAPESNPRILEYLKWDSSQPGAAKAWWEDDKQSWCGTFAAFCLSKAGYKIPKEWYRASEYSSNFGKKLEKPCFGAVVVFRRKGGGHVGFVVGEREDKIICLGGNQSSAVNIQSRAKTDVVGYYWPQPLNSEIEELPGIELYDLKKNTLDNKNVKELTNME